MAATLDVDDAQDIVDGYGDRKALAIQDVSEHRWYTRKLVVYEDEAGPAGFYYLDPASELQEDQERFESDPVEVFPVVGKEVVTTVYEKA